jgi:PRTRC genetic system protein E
MFVELMPMLRNRSLTIIVMDAGEGKLKVNIVPKQLKEDENPSLSLPLAPQMIEGTPEEFDRDLPEALKQFVANHLTIADAVAKSTAEVEEVKKNADAAVKAAKDEASKKLKKNNVTAKTATPTPAPAPAPPPPPSLFDALGAAPEPAPAATTVASEPTATIVAQSDDDPEGNEDDDEGETEDAPLLAGAAA